MMTFLEFIFLFTPLLGIASVPLGVAVIACDTILYSRWVPAMRSTMSTRKWPAVVIAFAPLLVFPTLEFLDDYVPPGLMPLLRSPWPLVCGGIACIAFAACWLKLSPQEGEDQDEKAKPPPARSLTSEWLLALAIFGANYIGLRLMPGRW